MSLIKEYFDLTKQYKEEYGEKTILLMQVGAFFEVYGMKTDEGTIEGSSITDFSQICELNMVDKKVCVGKKSVIMSGFKDIMIEKYLKKIQEAGFTAVVYTQDINAKNTSRSLAGIFSPGTYFHSDSKSLTNSITCIWVDYLENKVLLKGKYVVVGIANIDIYTGRTSLYQFKEIYINNPTTYDELERFISVYNPSEVILISNLPTEKEMNNIIHYAGISCNLIHKINIGQETQLKKDGNILKNISNCEKQPYQKEILSKFYQFDHFDIFIQNFNNNHIATQSFCYLLDFIYQHNPQLVNKLTEPVFENISSRLTLANHSLKQLNIINDGTVKPSKYSCISEMLNNCLTPMGKRKFLHNIVNPTFDEITLNMEYNITEYIIQNIALFERELKYKLPQIKDLSKFERQMTLKKISPKTFFDLYNSISVISDIAFFIQSDITVVEYLKNKNIDILEIRNDCQVLIDFIEQHLDIEVAKDIDILQQFDTNFIKKGIDFELDEKCELLNKSEQQLETIRDYLNNLIANKEKKTVKTSDFVKIHETEKNNYSLVSTSRRCQILKSFLPENESEVSLITKENEIFPFNNTFSQFTFEKQSSTNCFINTRHIKTLCQNISHIKISIKDIITRVYHQIIEKIGEHKEKIDKIIELITLVDMCYTKANIANKFNYCKPVIHHHVQKSFVDIKGLRHCLIEQFQMNELYVTNDIVIGDGETDGILLYGTNAVGKTTLIRALGVAVIMAQAGLYVPCSQFYFKPYKNLFTRIIGNDNIFKGLSTFEVEMSELRTILRMMDENSLVLGDELCSGTETISAISIFVAGIQKLYNAKSSFIFATHLHEIVNYEEIKSLSSVRLKHMEVTYNKEKDMLIYDRKLKDGSGVNMYGLEVCKSLNLPQDFLDIANEIRLKYNDEGKSILSLKQSRYNSNKIVNVCENCGKNMGTEVHHLQYQHCADSNGMIQTEDNIFHKNNLANLMTLCDACHDEIHKKNIKQKRVKTSRGYVPIDTK